MDSLEKQIEEARAAKSELDRLHGLAAELPALEEEAARRAQVAQADQVLTAARENAVQVVESTRPELAAIRAEFEAWIQSGQDLAQRLHVAEQPLFDAAWRLASAASNRARLDIPTDDIMRLSTELDGAADAALEQVGALDADLQPLPSTGDAWSERLARLVLEKAGRCFHPAARVEQFKRH